MRGAMDLDYVPANDGQDWIDRFDVRLCTAPPGLAALPNKSLPR